MKRRKDQSVSFSSVFFKIAVISALSGIAVFFCFSAVLAVILFLTDVPYRMYWIFSSAVIAVSSFEAGRTGGYHRRKAGIITGIICSFSVFLTAAVCFLFTSGKAEPFRTAFSFMISLISGAAGGVYGVNIRLKGRPFVYISDNSKR